MAVVSAGAEPEGSLGPRRRDEPHLPQLRVNPADVRGDEIQLEVCRARRDDDGDEAGATGQRQRGPLGRLLPANPFGAVGGEHHDADEAEGE